MASRMFPRRAELGCPAMVAMFGLEELLIPLLDTASMSSGFKSDTSRKKVLNSLFSSSRMVVQ